MNHKFSCTHLKSVTNIPLKTIINSKENAACYSCNYLGPKLWVCLYQNCLKIGCSDLPNDHSTEHFNIFPSHCVHMNLKSHRIWCYLCNTEVFMDASADSRDVKEIDSHSSQEKITSFNINSSENNAERSVGDSTDYSDSDDSDELGKPAGLVGLQNIGNTCYMNAALQALSNAPPLTRFFLDCASVVQLLSDGKKPGLSRVYQALMREIWTKKTGGYISAAGILYGIRSVHPMFRGYHQHDTQEFLRNFMDQLHEELKQQQHQHQNNENSQHSDHSENLPIDEGAASSSYDSSEGEYETCDSGVSERSSLSDETERVTNTKRRLSRSTSPGRRLKARLLSTGVIDCQPSSTNTTNGGGFKKQIKYRSIISDVFDGKLLSSVQCLTCNRISSRVETFQDLSLPIPSRDHLILLHGRGAQQGSCSEVVIPVQDGWISWIFGWLKSWFYGPVITLHDCLAAFFSTDELKGDNMYSCEKCNKLRNGIKFSKVLQLPEILCIHLKRFRHELMFSSKISSAVSFPLKGLEMKPYLHSECISKITSYELFSVICHHGTAGGGHYISFALNNGQWYEFDDQCVTKVSAEKVENCEAYVLFYRKSTAQAENIRLKAIKMSEEYLDSDTEIAYVSKQWINRFNTCAEPGLIDNSDFLCNHGSMNPDKVLILNQLSVIIPLPVYEYLHKIYGGCPPITCVQICPSCQAFNKRLLLEMETFVQLNNEAQSLNSPSTHLLSITWYNQWHNFVNKKTHDSPGSIDNTKIDCEEIDPSECVNIPEKIWNFFHNIYGGGPEIRLNKLSESENSDNENEENNIEDELSENEFDQNNSTELNNFCHGEPMDLGECNEKDANDANVVHNEEKQEEENVLPNSTNYCDSLKLSDISDDNAGIGCKNNNFHINNDSNRKIKLWLDSN